MTKDHEREVRVPELGESVVEATVGQWLKDEGDRVKVGDILVELETDKVNLEVGAEASGRLLRREAAEGDDVAIGDLLGVIDTADIDQDEPEETADDPEEADGDDDPEEADGDDDPEEADGDDDPGAADGGDDGGGDDGSDAEATGEDAVATPVARRMAREHDLDLRQLDGSGHGGRVTRADVERALRTTESGTAEAGRDESGTDKSGTDTSAGERTDDDRDDDRGERREHSDEVAAAPRDARQRRERMSRRRRTIAARLVEAQRTAAILTTFNDCDMSAIIALRKQRGQAFQERHQVKLGFMSFFVKATVVALQDFPALNAEIDGEEIVYKSHYDIGMAIGDDQGLVVPVIRDADRLNFAEIERRIQDYVQQVRDGELSVADLRGGTFTITNGGVFGSLLSTPILNPPQVGILGLHRIEQRAVVVDGDVVARPMMYVALSYDHRIVDGREAVRFLVRLKELIEDPTRLLLGA